MSKTLTKAAPAMGAKPPSGVTPGAPKMPTPAAPKIGGAPGGGVPGGAPKLGAPPKAPKMPKTAVPMTGQPTMGKGEPAPAGGAPKALGLTPETAMQRVVSKFGHLDAPGHLHQARLHLAAHSKNSSSDHIHMANAHTLHSLGMSQMGKGEAGALSGAGATLNAPMALAEDKPNKAQLDGMIKPSDAGKSKLPDKVTVKDITPSKQGSGGEKKKLPLGKALGDPGQEKAVARTDRPARATSRLAQMHSAYKGHQVDRESAHTVMSNNVHSGHDTGFIPVAPSGLGLGKMALGSMHDITMQSLAYGKPSAPAPHNPSLPYGGQSFSLQPVGMDKPTSQPSMAAQGAMPKGGLLDRFKTAWKGGAAKAAAAMPMGKSERDEAAKMVATLIKGLSPEQQVELAERLEKGDKGWTCPKCDTFTAGVKQSNTSSANHAKGCEHLQWREDNKIKSGKMAERTYTRGNLGGDTKKAELNKGELCKRCQSKPMEKDSLCKGCSSAVTTHKSGQ